MHKNLGVGAVLTYPGSCVSSVPASNFASLSLASVVVDPEALT